MNLAFITRNRGKALRIGLLCQRQYRDLSSSDLFILTDTTYDHFSLRFNTNYLEKAI